MDFQKRKHIRNPLYTLLISRGAILNIKFMTSIAESNLSSCDDFIMLIAGHRLKKSTRK